MAKVVKRGNSYVLDYFDNMGKRKRVTMPKGTTKKAAKEKLRSIEDHLSKGVYIPENNIPFFPEVAKEWLDHKKMNLRNSTWSVYEGHTKNHFKDFKDLKIDRITTKSVEEFILNMQKDKMNISTLRKILVSLRQIFSLAVRRNYCLINPVDNAEKPRSTGDQLNEKINILKPEKVNLFLKEVTEQKYYTLFSLAILSGARQGELLGLKWSDVDWDKSQIKIERSFNNGNFYQTKTKNSRRRIDIGPEMVKLLKRWRLACEASELDLVFPTEAGTPINHNNLVNRKFNPALEKAGIDRIRFHDLRHTYASILLDQGENIKYVQNQLGHSNPTVTLNVYAHLIKDENQESARKLESTIDIKELKLK